MNFLRKRLLIKVYSVCRLHNFLAFICYHTFMSLYTVFCKITKRIHIFNKKSAAESISCKFITHICDAMPVSSERGRSRFSKNSASGRFNSEPARSRAACYSNQLTSSFARSALASFSSTVYAILPTRVFGNSERNSIVYGIAYFAICFLQ